MNVKVFNLCLALGWLMVLAGGVLIHPGWGIAIAGALLMALTLASAYLGGITVQAPAKAAQPDATKAA